MVSTAELCTAPGDLLPVPKESLSQEEVADVSKLPFASDSGHAVTEAVRALFKQLLAGSLNDESDAFLSANNIPVTK